MKEFKLNPGEQLYRGMGGGDPHRAFISGRKCIVINCQNGELIDADTGQCPEHYKKPKDYKKHRGDPLGYAIPQ